MANLCAVMFPHREAMGVRRKYLHAFVFQLFLFCQNVLGPVGVLLTRYSSVTPSPWTRTPLGETADPLVSWRRLYSRLD